MKKTFRRKTRSDLNAERIATERLQRFNPLRSLSPESLRLAHEEFNAGRIRTAARLWDSIERTDDMIKTVAPKRKKAVSRTGWEIITDDDTPEAALHAEKLKAFYDHITAYRADDRNGRGGMALLVRQMMDAVGKKYSVHEIVWNATAAGELNAEFIFVPLWFFENTTGELRYLRGLTETGEELEPGGWLVHTGEGVMEASAVAYMFKHLPLQDWLILSEDFGKPVPVGECPDAFDSPGWRAMEDAVAAIKNCDGVVVGANGKITFANPLGGQHAPQPELIERMDRAIAMLWRGSDLATISKDNGTGASMQGDESNLLEEDDAAAITDTLNDQVDPFVIQYYFGDVAPKAWVKIKTKMRDDTKGDLEIDKGLHELGYESTKADLERRYNRTGLIPVPPENRRPFSPYALPNEDTTTHHPPLDTLLTNARSALAAAQRNGWQPVLQRLAHIVDETPDGELFAALEKFRTEELPQLANRIFESPESAAVLEQTMIAAMFNGWEEAQSAGNNAQ